MTLLFCIIPVFTCAFWCAALLLSYYESRKQERLRLGLFMLTCTILYIGHTLFFMRYPWQSLALTDTIYCFCNLAVFPLYYIYICSITDSFSLRGYRTLVISLAGMLLVGAVYLCMSPAERRLFYDNYLYTPGWQQMHGMVLLQSALHLLCRLVFMIQAIMVSIVCWRKTKHYNHKIQNYYADSEGKLYAISKTLIVLFLVTIAVSALCNFLGRNFFDHSWLLVLPSITFSTLIFLLGYKGFVHQFSLDDHLRITHSPLSLGHETEEDTAGNADCTDPPLEVNEDENDPLFTELAERIREELRAKQLYLQHNLSISDLAFILGTNRTYIYKAVNIGMGITFSELINRMRCEHATQIMNESPDKSHYLIADESGFSSLSSFYRNFRLYKGCTPKQWLSQQREET